MIRVKELHLTYENESNVDTTEFGIFRLRTEAKKTYTKCTRAKYNKMKCNLLNKRMKRKNSRNVN